MDQKTLLQLAKMHGTPLVVVDHKVLRENYEQFRKHLPRVQVYYAVKANSDPAIVQTFYDVGASFDVASMAEFLIVHEKIKDLPAQAAAGLHLGSHHLRQPDQGDRDAQAVGSIQAVGHLRQPRGGAQDRALRPALGPGVAVARAQHRVDGGAVEQVRRVAGRGRGPDRLRSQQQARGRGAELPRRQPVHERAKLHPGSAPGRRASSPRPRRAASISSCSTSVAASPPTTTTPSLPSRAWPKRSTPNWTAFFPSRSRFSPSRGGSWSPPPPPPSPRSSARPSVAASSATISMTASITPTAA